mgnify:CR=1 FL=1
MTDYRKKQSLIGKVVSSKMHKTVTVRVVREIPHPIYKKRVKRYKNYLAHIGNLSAKDGDVVKITSTRPISKRKRWQVSDLIREAVKIG